MTQLAETGHYPAVLANAKFRSAVREHLVTLGNESPGLGLRVRGNENAAVVFPRAGRSPKTYAELLALRWLDANVQGDEDDPTISLVPMEREEVVRFLALIKPGKE